MGTRKHPAVTWVDRSSTPGSADTFGVSSLQNSLAALSEAAPYVGTTFPGTPIVGDLWADTGVNVLRQYTSTGWAIVNFGLPANVLVVSPTGPYTTLSAALAAITTASATNRYAIWVFGRISETAQILAKSFVNVIGYNARVEVTNVTSGQGALSFPPGTTNATWRNLTIVRLGALTGVSSTPVVFMVNVGPDSTVILDSVVMRNECTIGSGTPAAYGVYLSSSVSPTLRNCSAVILNTLVSAGHALLLLGTANPLVEGGVYRAAPGVGAAGISLQNQARGTFRGVTFDGGTGTYGALVNHTTAPTFEDCTMLAGSAVNAYGAYNIHSSVARYKNCRFAGGLTGNGVYGFVALNNAAPVLANCVSEPGIGGTGAAYFYDSNSRARMSQCQANVPQPVQATQQFAATGTFVLNAATAAQLETLYVSVDAAAAGGLVSIGTTLGGTDLINAQDASTTGIKFPALGASLAHVIAAGGLLYVTLTGAITVTVLWTSVLALASSYGLLINNAGVTGWIDGCTFVGSAVAAGIRFNGNPSGDFRVTNSLAQARNRSDVARLKGATASAAYNPAPLYRCVFVAGSTNLTCPAGTANGSSLEI